MARRKIEDQRDTEQAMAIAGVTTTAGAMRAGVPFTSQPELGEGYGRISVHVFDLPDPETEYRELVDQLGHTTALDGPVERLDNAEDNARRAHRLYVCARVDAERFNLDAELVEAAMRGQAIERLQHEKTIGQRSKAITEADVTAMSAAMFPDEWRDLADRRIKSRKMLEHLEAFASLWTSRCHSLSRLIEARR
jgi:hypothetical protein